MLRFFTLLNKPSNHTYFSIYTNTDKICKSVYNAFEHNDIVNVRLEIQPSHEYMNILQYLLNHNIPITTAHDHYQFIHIAHLKKDELKILESHPNITNITINN